MRRDGGAVAWKEGKETGSVSNGGGKGRKEGYRF